MKKIVSLVLALVLCTALATPAMAIKDNYEGKWINVSTSIPLLTGQTAYFYCIKHPSFGNIDIMVYKVLNGNISKSKTYANPKNVVSTVDSANIPQEVLAEAAKDYPEFFSTGSVLSFGYPWIVIAIPVLAAVGVATLVIVKKKKKKPALASGVEDTDEE